MTFPPCAALLCLALVLYNAANHDCANVFVKYELTERPLCPGYRIAEETAMSETQCAIKCHRNTVRTSYKCIGFCFNVSTKNCTLYKKNLSEGGQDSKWVTARRHASGRNWADAVSICEASNQWLVIPQTQEEIDKIGLSIGGTYYYVGLNSLHQHANFTTKDGKTPLRFFWRTSAGQPSLSSTEDCVVGYYIEGWYDMTCSTGYYVFCQMPEPVTCLEGELMDKIVNGTYDTSLEPCYKLKYD